MKINPQPSKILNNRKPFTLEILEFSDVQILEFPHDKK